MGAVQRGDSGRTSRVHWLSLAVIVAIGAAVRAKYLSQPVRYDEAYTYLFYALKPVRAAVADYTYPNNHVLYTILAHFSLRAFGRDLWALRLPAYVFGVLIVPAAFFAARSLYGPNAALFCASLVAVSSSLIEYSVDGRGYTLLVFVSLAMVWLGASILSGPTIAKWLAFSVLGITGLYTVPVMLFPLAGVALWVFASAAVGDAKSSARVMLVGLLAAGGLTGAVTLLLYRPIISHLGLKALTENQFVASLPFAEVTRRLPGELATMWKLWTLGLPFGVVLVLIACFVVACSYHRRLAEHRVPLVAAAIAAAILGIVVQRVAPHARIWLYLLPLFLAVAAAGSTFVITRVSSVRERAWAIPVIAILVAIALSLTTVQSKAVARSGAEGTLPDAERITVFLTEHGLTPGDRVVATAPSDIPLLYYFVRHHVPIGYLYEPALPGHRIVVVVNRLASQDSFELLGRALPGNVSFDDALARMKVVRTYPSATLWEIRI